MPEVLGPWRLIRPLGAGGMGSIFLVEMAEDRPYATAGSRVALKFLRPELLSDRDAVQRFLREGRIGAAIRHPGVVRTYHADAVTEGAATHHVLVLEYVEGRTLRALMDALRTLPEALLRDVGLQIARALAAVHQAGAVHRDVKPGNVILTPDHSVKLMDLGISVLMEEAVRLSAAGEFFGSIHYAAPEQFTGGEVSPATDLYALGVLLYEAATGGVPFDGGDPLRIMRLHAEHVPPRVGEINPQLTPLFEELVACLMEKDPRRRPASADHVAEILASGEACPWWRERETAARAAIPRRRFRRIRVTRETALVGRENEIETLLSLYGKAKEGEGRLVLIEGEAGVGKTRLLDEFMRKLDEDGEEVHFLYGSNTPGGAGGARGALTQGLLDHFGEANVEAGLRPYLTVTPALVAPFAALLQGLPAEPLAPDAVRALFCHLARALARERPVVWIVEDLHFGSAAGRALILSLARIAGAERLLLVATTRPGLPAEETDAFRGIPLTHRMELGRLDPSAMSFLLAEAVGSISLAGRLAPRVGEKSGGNPFFALEILRDLREGETLRRNTDGTWKATGDVEAVTVPTTVRDLLLTRLRNLSREQGDLLDVGAVQGFTFDPGLVAGVLGRESLEVLQSLASLERHDGLVHGTGRSFRFDHHLLQEVIYEATPEPLRVEYHARLAAKYEERGGEGELSPDEVPGEVAVFLAVHYLRGGEGGSGRRFLARAMEHLASRYQNEDLLELTELALEDLGDSDPALRCDIRLQQAGGLNLLGRRVEQRAAVEDAIASAEKAGDGARLAGALSMLGILLENTSDYEGERRIMEQVLEKASGLGDKLLEARALINLGNASARLCDYEAAGKWFERSLGAFREAGYRTGEGHATGNMGVLLDRLGDYEGARRRYQESCSIAREIGDRPGEACALGNLGVTLAKLGDYEGGLELQERALAIYREIGGREGESRALDVLGVLFQKLGRFPEAVEHHEASLEICRETENLEGQCFSMGNLACASAMLGSCQEARQWSEEALTLARRIGALQSEVEQICVLGNLHVCEGQLDRAGDHFESALAMARDAGERMLEITAHGGLGRLALQAGRMDEAEAHLEAHLDLSRQAGVRPEWCEALLALGDLALVRGKSAEGETRYREALEIARDLNQCDLVARSLTGLGRHLMEQDDREEARALLAEAEEMVVGIGLADPGPLPAAWLALLRERDPASVEVTGLSPVGIRAEAHLVLHRAGAGGDALSRARSLLEKMSCHLEGGDLEAFWRWNPTARGLRQEERKVSDC